MRALLRLECPSEKRFHSPIRVCTIWESVRRTPDSNERAEYRDESTPESIIAHDADQLEMLLELQEHLEKGITKAADWTPFRLRRLRTDTAKALAESILDGDPASWWFDRDSEWWVRGGKS